MHTMQNPNQFEPEVVDLAEVSDDLYAYELETVRRDAEGVGTAPTPSALTFEPQLSEFTD
jgi:hypothetical protein